MLRARLIGLPCLLLALVVGGCGSGSAAGGADPATAVPAGTAIYFEGVVRPEGSQKDDVLDAAGKVLGTDEPERKLREFIDRGLAKSDSGDVTWERDIAPWLGKKAGLWIAGVGRAKPGWVVLAATKDSEKAQAAIDKGAKADGGKVSERSYKGVDYQVDSDGVAAGIVDDFFTVGTEAEFKRTVRAADGASLAEEKRYQSLVDRLDPGRIGQLYVDPGPFISQALRADPQAAAQVAQLRSLFSAGQVPPVAGSLLADGDRIAFDSFTRGKGVGTRGPLGSLAGVSSTPLLGELPGDAWVALGAAKVGPALRAVFSRGAGALGGAVAAQQLKQQLGLDLQRDVFGWMGDVAVFARGTSRADLDGGVVISSTNAARMRAAFGKLVGLVQTKGGEKVTPVRVKGAALAFRAGSTDLGKPVVMARSDDRVVVAVGEPAASAALAPRSKLGDSPLFGQARAILAAGQEPSFLLSMPRLLAAIERMGHPDADYAKAKPYLDAFSVLAAGGSVKGDEAHSRFAAGLK